jgi:hypothetical protein
MLQNLININDTLYTVERIISQQAEIDVNLFKKFTDTTDVFLKDGLLWFCRLVEDAVIVDDDEIVVDKPKKRGRPTKKNLDK